MLRASAFYQETLGLPTVLIAILTGAMFFVPPATGERLVLGRTRWCLESRSQAVTCSRTRLYMLLPREVKLRWCLMEPVCKGVKGFEQT